MTFRYYPILCLLVLLVVNSGCDRRTQPVVVIENEPTVGSFISTFVDGGATYKDISFAEVVEAASGNQILPIDPQDPLDALVLDELEQAIKAVIEFLNTEPSPIAQARKITDLADPIDAKFIELLQAAPGFQCDYARKQDGNILRSGYPDLRLVHQESGRVIYIDPRLVRASTFDSSLKTFFYNPKSEFGKIHDDGNHLLIGIEHDGNTGNWKFSDWHLVDLYHFRVRLQAEFQARNKDVYLPEFTIRRSEKP